ncbi:hypothetical protein [Cylindrospermopsis raciborskii]|uniref:hypothetical protein n=1 Tax=Cylindrospermopsis raciborskii TaxID=77022 RepID=UPI00215A1A41|nr:hypothetical protein [Cylindrospermopsis raciborskii]
MYQSEAPPLKTISTDLPSQDIDKDIDEELDSTIHPRPPWETLPSPPGTVSRCGKTG